MEKDFLIYNELAAAAVKVFNEGIDAPAGTYTLAELAKVGTTCKTAPEGVNFREDYNADNLINIDINGFKCSLPMRHIFAIARRFETLANVGAKDRAIFTRAMEHGEPVAVFTLDAVTVENLAACEDPHKGIRPQMQGVFCDIAAGLSCCSNGYALNVARLADAQVMDAGALNNGGVILSRAFAKAGQIVLTGFKSLSLLSPCSFNDFDLTQVAAAAYQLANPGKYNFNAFAAFAASTTESTDNADTLDVAPAVPVINPYVIGSVKNRETRKKLKSSNKTTI